MTVNFENFDPVWINIDKNTDIYYIGYITIKNFRYTKVNSVNPLYFIIDKADVYFEESKGNKYLRLVSTDKN